MGWRVSPGPSAFAAQFAGQFAVGVDDIDCRAPAVEQVDAAVIGAQGRDDEAEGQLVGFVAAAPDFRGSAATGWRQPGWRRCESLASCWNLKPLDRQEVRTRAEGSAAISVQMAKVVRREDAPASFMARPFRQELQDVRPHGATHDRVTQKPSSMTPTKMPGMLPIQPGTSAPPMAANTPRGYLTVV
ncbi:MAG: hypothetical protein IPH48_07190 [bacterium]|nr:hypothetical protein [bacterium]